MLPVLRVVGRRPHSLMQSGSSSPWGEARVCEVVLVCLFVVQSWVEQ